MKQTQYGKYTYNSPSFIRRTTHQLRLKRSVKTLNIQPTDCVLDFGAGDGYLASMIRSEKNNHISCYEPVAEQYEQMKFLLSDFSDIKIVNDIQELSTQKFDKIFCLEVMEHLPEKQLNDSLQNIHKLLNKNGKALLTVPCESGFNGFFKNCIKKMVDNNKAYTFNDLWMISFNKKKVERVVKHQDTHPYIYEHFGFNNTVFETHILANNFNIEKKFHFPFRILKLFSSQEFYVVSKH